ncbi:MAG TPA: tetratricopeptide repeat protein [Wenzhouxiangella sp.]|nr:tetratricopeptide repeat protein [Wenzhouxiangella sp.]
MNPEAIESLIENGRDSYEARLAAGQARLKQGDLVEAIAHLEKAVEFRADQTMAWQELGKAHRDQGDGQAALAAWTKGVEVARSNGDKQAEKVMSVWLRRLDRLEG